MPLTRHAENTSSASFAVHRACDPSFALRCRPPDWRMYHQSTRFWIKMRSGRRIPMSCLGGTQAYRKTKVPTLKVSRQPGQLERSIPRPAALNNGKITESGGFVRTSATVNSLASHDIE